MVELFVGSPQQSAIAAANKPLDRIFGFYGFSGQLLLTEFV